MISIIICSKNSDISQSLKENIAKTIGLEHELVVIDNSKNLYSIFQAYNMGVEKSKEDVLCFMHDDILYHTQNWGRYVLQYFEDDTIGLIGTSGTHFLPNTPTGWYWSKLNSGGCIQHVSNDNEHITEHQFFQQYFREKNSIEVVAIDGMWFCIKKELFNSISFDETTFHGFHCYDIDISLEVRSKGKKVIVVNNVIIEHYSIGNFSKDWALDTIKLYEKWKYALPQLAGIDITEHEMQIREELVSEIFSWMKAYAFLKSDLDQIKNSYAYKIGKKILKPYKWIKRLLH